MNLLLAYLQLAWTYDQATREVARPAVLLLEPQRFSSTKRFQTAVEKQGGIYMRAGEVYPLLGGHGLVFKPAGEKQIDVALSHLHLGKRVRICTTTDILRADHADSRVAEVALELKVRRSKKGKQAVRGRFEVY